ncbi:unnamed protein product [Ceutorhynchus assimilis]|uniref:Uncharacterized protein n=1 Tax=Ceutorhynchus assimilis TaxID=467358 RepID=A0A9N9MCQ1_9CUCU|nr:unnamed protein product [Ceutorhynchus assimilis]
MSDATFNTVSAKSKLKILDNEEQIHGDLNDDGLLENTLFAPLLAMPCSPRNISREIQKPALDDIENAETNCELTDLLDKTCVLDTELDILDNKKQILNDPNDDGLLENTLFAPLLAMPSSLKNIATEIQRPALDDIENGETNCEFTDLLDKTWVLDTGIYESTLEPLPEPTKSIDTEEQNARNNIKSRRKSKCCVEVLYCWNHLSTILLSLGLLATIYAVIYVFCIMKKK